ncbi:low molecular weight protein-tyrosine-phosphatase [Bacillus nakamurai]|uniref:low molecular weight protein-tyrosine-phosphatase n=1 Tax=Bacillus nakamurai TaxID=1793963 RepID=UPI001E366CBF|nr:low molecular weight protein-tyrosine-phosphatase [Bacillus nakamurai]MCC9022459.1 low molecular weight phosphotyrosine protein phosphatase [Bacillus nakamurai]
MIHVLFVCLGNICRSPMAEALFSDMVKKNGLEGEIKTDSAGIGAWHTGNPPHEGTQDILKQKGISTSGITARQVRESDLTDFDYVIAMDAENIGHLRSMAGYKKEAKIGRLLDYVKDADLADVPDPYYTGNFSEVYALIESGCRHLLESIKKDHHL